MEWLIEMFPVTFGVLLGLTVQRLLPPGRQAVVGLPAALGLGAFATLASGEWRESPWFFLVDMGTVAGVAAATVWALRWWSLRRARTH
jgi:hypothetical protein